MGSLESVESPKQHRIRSFSQWYLLKTDHLNLGYNVQSWQWGGAAVHQALGRALRLESHNSPDSTESPRPTPHTVQVQEAWFLGTIPYHKCS